MCMHIVFFIKYMHTYELNTLYLPTTHMYTYIDAYVHNAYMHTCIYIHACFDAYIHIYIDRVRTRPGNPGIYWNFENHNYPGLEKPGNLALIIISWKSLEFHPFCI